MQSHGHHGHGSEEQTVIIRSHTNPDHYLFVSNDGVRGHGNDFDIRTHHSSNEDRNKLVLVHVDGNVYLIRSHTNPNFFLFPANDGSKKFGNDFDVRAHNASEERNQWLLNRVKDNVFTIRSRSNPDHFLFAANDKSNALNDDFDVRTHAHSEDRNKWTIDNFVLHTVQQAVVLRPVTKPSQILFVSNDDHRKFGNDFDVRTHNGQENRNQVHFIHVENNVYLIRSVTNTDHYIFVSNDHHRKFHDDFDVRTHNAANEDRNKWIVEHAGGDHFTIRSHTNPDHYLFAADDGSNAYGQDLDVRTHAHKEERNKWHIDGFFY